MFLKMSKLINLYFIIIVIHKNAKIHINNDFIILKLNVLEIKLKLHSKMANFNYKIQNCKCTKIINI